MWLIFYYACLRKQDQDLKDKIFGSLVKTYLYLLLKPNECLSFILEEKNVVITAYTLYLQTVINIQYSWIFSQA